MTRKMGAGTVIVLALLCVAACTSSTGKGPSSSTNTATAPSVSPRASSPSSSSSSPSVDPQAADATRAYLAFVAAVNAADQHPSDTNVVKALTKFAVDPALGVETQHILGYRTAGIAWSGMPPMSRVRVTRSNATATYPTVVLTDCPTVAASWKPYDGRTHKPVPVTYPAGSAAPPHAVTVKVILFKGRWMVQSTRTDVKHTCSPS